MHLLKSDATRQHQLLAIREPKPSQWMVCLPEMVINKQEPWVFEQLGFEKLYADKAIEVAAWGSIHASVHLIECEALASVDCEWFTFITLRMLCGSIAAVIPILVDIQTSRGQHFAAKKLSLLPGVLLQVFPPEGCSDVDSFVSDVVSALLNPLSFVTDVALLAAYMVSGWLCDALRLLHSPLPGWCIGAGFPSLVLQWIDAVAEYSRFGAAVVEQLLDTDDLLKLLSSFAKWCAAC
ncbi:hypothetical protein Nepgr_032227 [Nepenthes gracilis]|uniref:Uncharacterized protein n=1 Tax=Nepenthes gracilis TaxID=150966 RepID=A0AAD3TJK1_NEPGR|nr:hypothetical protein Nepgr_032227 [Nepenthes gracilis]